MRSINALSHALGPFEERHFEHTGLAPTTNEIERASIPQEWTDAEYRHASMEATVQNMIAWQVRINREERGLTQAALARLMGTGQSAISKLEDADGGDVMLSTLIKAARAFDCALMVQLVDYDSFAAHTRDVSPERLFAPGFADQFPALTAKTKRRRALFAK